MIYSTDAHVEMFQSNRAYFDRAADKIVLPLREQFKGKAEPFYSTALYELGHRTGHTSRLAREFGKAYGNPENAKEELIADLTLAFCCAHLGFSKTISSNEAYLGHWLGILCADNKAIVSAATQAKRPLATLLKNQSILHIIAIWSNGRKISIVSLNLLN